MYFNDVRITLNFGAFEIRTEVTLSFTVFLVYQVILGLHT